MSETIGRGVIELAADGTKLEAGINSAKRSLKSLKAEAEGAIGGEKAARSIDRYVSKLQFAAATTGKTTRETELLRLALRGASEAQLKAADSALRLTEAHQRGVQIGEQIRGGMIRLAQAAAVAAAAITAYTISMVNQAGKFQDVAEKIGDTARNVSSLKEAADVGGISIDTVASASVKLTKALAGTDDESKAAGEAIKALGLNYKEFKALSPTEQLESVARAMQEFGNGSEKTAVAVALFGKSGAELMPFLNEYADKGRTAAFLTDEQAAAMDAAADGMARYKSQAEQYVQLTVAGLLPALDRLITAFGEFNTGMGASSLASEILVAAGKALRVVLETIVIAAANVAYVVRAVGVEIYGMAKQIWALANLDLKGFNAISEAVKEDAAKARKTLDDFQSRILNLSTPAYKDPRILFNPGTIAEQAKEMGVSSKKKLNISGLNQDKDKSATTAAEKARREREAIAKAQLDADISNIRRQGEAEANAVSNSARITEAARAANLIGLKSYYDQKRTYLQADTAISEAALTSEISRLQQEKLGGKEKVDNARKIEEAEAKLAKMRADSTTSLQVLSIQEKAAFDTITRSYDDAAAAASAYLDVVQRLADRELAGIGKGNKKRSFDSGLNSIDDQYAGKEQELQRDNRNGKFVGREDDYNKELQLLREQKAAEVEIYLSSYKLMEEKRGEFYTGAQEALSNYLDETQDTFGQIKGITEGAFKGMEDALVGFVTTGKMDFKSLANSIIADIARMAIQKAILGPLAGIMSGFLGNVFGGGRAAGGPVSQGKMYEVGEGNKPELLQSGGKTFLIPGNNGNVSPTRSGGEGGKASINLSPTYNINIDSSTDKAQVKALVERAIRNGNAQLVDQLQVAGRI